MPRRIDPIGSHVTRTARVATSVGLHARPAARFAQLAAGFAPLRITVTAPDGRSADAASILSLLALGIEHGTVLTLAGDGPEAAAALDALVELLENEVD